MTSERCESEGSGFLSNFQTENYKIQRMIVYQSVLFMAKKANFFDSIFTGDEKWIACDNTNRWSQWLD